jgi:hypothetical protein
VGELPFDSGMWELEKDNDGDINGWRKEYFKLVSESEYLKQQERESQIKQVQEFGWFGPSGAGKNAADTVKYDFICPYSKKGFKNGDECYFICSKLMDTNVAHARFDGLLPNADFAYFHKESDALAWNKAMFGEKEEEETLEEKLSELQDYVIHLEIKINTIFLAMDAIGNEIKKNNSLI